MKRIYTLFFALLFVNLAYAQVEGTWKLSPIAEAMAVGPTQGDFGWWANSAADVTTRACLFDDEFVFNTDGSFQNVQGDATWVEGWQGVDPEACAAAVAPHDGSAAATWVDNGDGTVTITGTGAHLGLAKVVNGGELTTPSAAPASITYPYVIEGNTMTIDIDFGGGFWHFVFEKEGGTSVEEVVENQFSFFPNPANSAIQITSNEQLDQISIRDITGKVVFVQANPAQTQTINVSNLAKGFYILESRKDNTVSAQKLSIH